MSGFYVRSEDLVTLQPQVHLSNPTDPFLSKDALQVRVHPVLSPRSCKPISYFLLSQKANICFEYSKVINFILSRYASRFLIKMNTLLFPIHQHCSRYHSRIYHTFRTNLIQCRRTGRTAPNLVLQVNMQKREICLRPLYL